MARTLRRLVAVLALSLPLALAACETESQSCSDAKDHLCSKIQQQACLPSTMANAVQKIEDACGQEEADRFVPAAAAYCTSAMSFSASTCASQ